jgi:hypothetical protein
MMGNFVYSLYDFLQEKGLELNSLFTDTDSFAFHVQGSTRPFPVSGQMTHLFNTTKYKVFDTTFNEPLTKIKTTHEALCMMKSETKNVGITSFCGVASKVYSFIAGEKKAIKGKGVSEALQKKYLSHGSTAT